MKKHLLLGLGVVVVVIVTFYFFSAGRVAAPEDAVPAAEIIDENTEASSTGTPLSSEKTGEEGNVSESQKTTQTTKPKSSSPTSGATTPAPVTPLPLPNTVTVIYDGNRFIPKEAVVLEGGTVRFINTGTEKMWVASDNHPTRTRYPVKDETSCSGQSFDQCASIGNGESWSFVFTSLGTWGYHNHVRTRDSGSVRVMTEKAYIEEYR